MKRLLFLPLIFIFLVGCNPTTDTSTTTTTTTTDTPAVFFPIVITPSDLTMITNNSVTFKASGGKPPYTFTITSGSGSISSTLGIFNSDSNTGNVIIQVKDSVGAIATNKIKVVQPLNLLPSQVKINVGGAYQLETSGGIPPYNYQIVTGAGMISPIGWYTAGLTPSSVQVKVVDSKGNESYSNIEINYPIQINPSSVNMNRGDLFQLDSTYGFPPYTYQIISGSGSVVPLTGVFTAPAVSGTTVIQAIDSIGSISSSNITINNLPLSLNNDSPTMQVNQNFVFKVIGGLAPYTFSFDPNFTNLGSLLPTGTYFAPSVVTVDHLRVTDSEGTIFNATVTVNPALSISPTSKVTVVNRAEIFTAAGGVPPYTFQLYSGNGSMNPTSGVFIAPSTAGTSIIRLQDSKGNYVDATVTINPDVLISPVNPQIMVGNSVNFLGSGGIPPFQYDIIAGPGSISTSGVYTANGGSGAAIIQVKDSKNTTKTTTVYIQPQLKFDEDPIVVKSGNTKNILISGGVPPYTIQFRDPNTSNVTNFSIYGSTVVNNNYLLNASPLYVQSGSPEIQVTRSSHGLTVGEQIQFRSLASCDVFTAADLNINYSVSSIIDSNTFTVTSSKSASSTLNCGGSNGFYLRLTGILPYKAGIVSTQTYETLVVKDSLQNQVEKQVLIDSGLIAQFDINLANGVSNKNGQGCQTQTIYNLITSNSAASLFGCPDSQPWFLQSSRTSPLSPINFMRTGPVGLDFNLPFNNNATESNSFEIWFRWNGSRLSSTFSRMDAVLLGLSNQNVGFMSIKTGASSFDNALCFNTKTTTPYDCYGVKNIDSFVSNRWTQFIFIINNGDIKKNKMYVNGVEQSLVTIGSGASLSTVQSGPNVKLGGSYIPIPTSGSDVNSSTIGGQVGYIKIFNRVLTSDEISNSYNNIKDRYQDFGGTP